MNLFLDKIDLNTASEPFSFPGYTIFFLRMKILSTNFLYVLCIYKQVTEYIRKRASQQAGGDLLS